MSKYVCSICGYVYDEEKETVRFDELNADWVCPWCTAPKSAFELKKAENQEKKAVIEENREELRALSEKEMAILCSNLAKGCEKQYLSEEQQLLSELAEYFDSRASLPQNVTLDEIHTELKNDLAITYEKCFDISRAHADRGAQRALTWSQKVSRMMDTILDRVAKEGVDFLENMNVYVCDVCGFIYIGEKAPDLCPVCKVPDWKFKQIERRA